MVNQKSVVLLEKDFIFPFLSTGAGSLKLMIGISLLSLCENYRQYFLSLQSKYEFSERRYKIHFRILEILLPPCQTRIYAALP